MFLATGGLLIWHFESCLALLCSTKNFGIDEAKGRLADAMILLVHAQCLCLLFLWCVDLLSSSTPDPDIHMSESMCVVFTVSHMRQLFKAQDNRIELQTHAEFGFF